MRSKMYRPGVSLVEVILASTLFTIVVSTIVGSLLYSLDAVSATGTRNRALLLSQEGLEALQTLRDRDIALLEDGTHGLSLSNGQWNLVASADVTLPFTRSVTIASLGSATKSLQATVSWPESIERGGSVVLATYVTNWRTVAATQADQIVFETGNLRLSGSSHNELKGIDLENPGSMTVVIDKMRVSWNKSNQNMKEIKIEDIVRWSNNGPGTPTGVQSSSTLIDIQDVTIPAGEDDVDLTRIKMTGNADGDTFTILFLFGDGSTKQLTVTPPT